MTSEEGNEEEGPRPARPLPPDDRLWRHPSELAGGVAPPAAWASSPATDPRRRTMAAAALASACLAGAVVAVGVMWVARPTRVVHDASVRTTQARPAAASFAPSQASTADLASSLAPSLVRVQVGHSDRWSSGTGIWLDDGGALLVATPLLGGDPSDAITVDRVGQAPMPAMVVGSDAAPGISVVQVGDGHGTPLDVATADPPVGATVAVIGAARPAASARSTEARTVTAAIGTVGDRASVPPLVLHDALLLDRRVPEDAVGSVVVDGKGRVVGVVVAAANDDGLAVVAPAAEAIDAARDLRGDGQVRRAWLGVRAVDVSPAEALLLDVPGGARLTQVTPGSPAAATGLHPDDVVTSVDGQRVLDASDLVTALRRGRPGERVLLEWRRGTERHGADCTLGG